MTPFNHFKSLFINETRKKAFCIVACILLLVFLSIPVVFVYLNESSDAFMYSSATDAQFSINQDKLVINPFEISPSARIGLPWQVSANEQSVRLYVTSLYVMISQVTGLSISQMLFLPIIGIVLILLSFTLGWVFSRSIIVAIMFAAFNAYGYYNMSLFYVSLGFALHITFLIIFTIIVKDKTNSRVNTSLLLLTFIACYLTYYTAEFFNLAILCSFFLIVIFARFCRSRINLEKKCDSFINVVFLFLIFFFMFESHVTLFLKNADVSNLIGSFSTYFSYVSDFILGNTTAVATFRPSFTNSVSLYLDLFVRLLYVLSILIYLIFFVVVSLKRHHMLKLKGSSVLFLSILIVMILETLLYWLYGPATGFRYFLWFAPLLACFSLDRLGKRLHLKKFFIILMILMLSFEVAKYAVVVNDPINNANGEKIYSLASSSTRWIVENVDSGSVVSDYHISARLMFEATVEQKGNAVYSYKIYNDLDVLYQFNETLVNSLFMTKYYEYIIMSRTFETQAVMGDAWSPVGPPLGDNVTFFNDYSSFHKISDDGTCWVYRFYK